LTRRLTRGFGSTPEPEAGADLADDLFGGQRVEAAPYRLFERGACAARAEEVAGGLRQGRKGWLPSRSAASEDTLTLTVVAQAWVTCWSRRMVTVTLRCQHCQSQNIVRNGLADGRQPYLCRDCSKRSREQPRTNAYSNEEREQILRAYDERSSLRGLSRTFGVSRQTVTAWLKKR
jgi:transposase-like protein